MLEDLEKHWEVLSEAVQVRLRLRGVHDAYEKLLELSRGRVLDKDGYVNIVEEHGGDDVLRLLEPATYIGCAPEIARTVARECVRCADDVESRAKSVVDGLKVLKVLGWSPDTLS